MLHTLFLPIRYGFHIGDVFRKWNNQRLSYLRNFGEGWGFIAGTSAVSFVDNHDNQRGHGGGGASILTFRDANLYKMANAFTLAWDYGQPRIMSSYMWTPFEADWIGPPSDANGIYFH